VVVQMFGVCAKAFEISVALTKRQMERWMQIPTSSVYFYTSSIPPELVVYSVVCFASQSTEVSQAIANYVANQFMTRSAKMTLPHLVISDSFERNGRFR